jgi:hypothetical protein
MHSVPTIRVIAAGMIGNVLEWYDFAIYGYFASAIGRQLRRWRRGKTAHRANNSSAFHPLRISTCRPEDHLVRRRIGHQIATFPSLIAERTVYAAQLLYRIAFRRQQQFSEEIALAHRINIGQSPFPICFDVAPYWEGHLRGVALVLEAGGDGRELFRHADRRARDADLGEAGAIDALPGDEG